MNSLHRLLGACCFFAAAIGDTAARAETIIVFDTFTGALDGAGLTGRTPDGGNLPGGTWVTRGTAPLITSSTPGYGDPVPGVFGNGNVGSAVALAGGGYNPPAVIRISADLKMSPPGFPATTGSAADGRGLALGFYDSSSTDSGSFSQNFFTGLVLDASGSLNLVHDPNATGFFTGPGSFLGTPVAYGGTWDPTAFVTLSYTVDMTTGGLSEITLSGSSADYSSFYGTALFTASATAFGGMYHSATTNFTLSAADNFKVTAVPEPTPLLLLATAGVLGVAGRVWRFTGRPVQPS